MGCELSTTSTSESSENRSFEGTSSDFFFGVKRGSLTGVRSPFALLCMTLEKAALGVILKSSALTLALHGQRGLAGAASGVSVERMENSSSDDVKSSGDVTRFEDSDETIITGWVLDFIRLTSSSSLQLSALEVEGGVGGVAP